MTPTYLNSSTSPFPAAVREDQQLQLHNTAKPQASPSSSLSSHVFTYPIQDQGGCYHKELHQLEYQQEANNFASHHGSIDHSALDGASDRGLKFSLWKKEDGHENQTDQSGLAKWMPLKIRLMRKMNSDQTVTEAPAANAPLKFEDQKPLSSPFETDNSSSNNSNNTIRVCSDCNTTKTPLWRSGPRGPKSLCNACGIRQRKARRAMAAAAAAAANGTILAAETSSVKKTKVQHKDKRSKNIGHAAKYKKRSKLATPSHHGRKKLCFEDFLISLSKNLAFHQVFPQDEKEAAILLMALSCGLVHG